MTAFDWDVVDDFFTSDFVETATYLTVEYDAIRFKKDQDQSVVDAGESDNVDFMLMLKSADVTPLVDNLITFDSVVYKIDRASLDSTGKTWTLTLVERYG